MSETAIRKFSGSRLLVASHNAGKLREIEDLLAPYGIEVQSAASLGLPEPEETGLTYEANAILKAESAAQAAGLPALSDDSGISVRALNGEPGIYSARWAGPDRDFGMAMRAVWDRVAVQDDRRARFVSVLALAWPDGHVDCFEGHVDGTLVWPPRGDKGFGYDPMFVPDGYEITFGEMDPAHKHEISHRAVAFRKLVEAVFD